MPGRRTRPAFGPARHPALGVTPRSERAQGPQDGRHAAAEAGRERLELAVADHRDAEPGGCVADGRGAVGRGGRDGDRLHARVLGAEAVVVDDDPAPRGDDALAPVGLAEPGARAGRVVRVDPALAGLVRGVVRLVEPADAALEPAVGVEARGVHLAPSQRQGMNGDIRRSPARRQERKATTARARSGAALTA